MREVEEYITQVEFCRRLGISRQALLHATKRDRVTIEMHNGKRQIEYHRNRRSYIRSSRTPERFVSMTGEAIVKHKTTEGKKDRISKLKNGFHPMDLIEDPPDKDGDFHSGMNRVEAESVKQVYLAKQAKLKFLKSAGILIESEVVKREWEEIAVRVQKSMLAIPDRVSEIFASVNDADKIHNDLTAEIRHVLTSLQYRVKIGGEYDRIEKIVKEEVDPEE